MHADTLYHRMLSQERAIQDAESAGLPPPQFHPILSSASSPSAAVITATSDPLSSTARKSLEERLRLMPREEAEVEERAAAMEAKQDENVGREIGGLWEGRARERMERRERGETTIGDWVSGLFGR